MQKFLNSVIIVQIEKSTNKIINHMLTQFSTAQLFEDFLNQLLTDAGMDTVSAEVRQQMLSDLRARLENRLLGTIVMHLPEAEISNFNKLVEDPGAEEKVAKFIDEKVPDSSELFATAMLSFRNDYLGLK